MDLSQLMDDLKKPDYPESLDEPLKSYLQTALAANVAAAADELELALRKHAVNLCSSGTTLAKSALEQLGLFWHHSLHVCFHVSALEDSNETYKSLHARRAPFFMLEDVIDSLTTADAKELWEQYVECMFPILFSDCIWKPAGSSRPCWLPCLKLCNRFIQRLDSVWAARIMMTLAQIFPLSEKSASMKWGSRNTETVAMFETEKEFGEEASVALQTPQAAAPPISTYSFYKTFWSLQQDFASSSIQDLASFLSRLKTVMNVLETMRPDQDAITSSAAAAAAAAADTSILANKYLISSRLLPIQLVDSQFRTCILSQFLIVAHNLALEAPSVGAQLESLQQRAKGLLPADFLSMLECTLHTSEMQWRQWKKDKCPDLETNVKAFMEASGAVKTRKRRFGDMNGNATSNESVYTRIDLCKDLPQICRNMKQLVPSVDDHLEEYMEALDPDSGIEAEYHPKNNEFFNWQALRLMSMKYLADFDKIQPNGDYEPLVRHIWQRDKKVTVPGSAPEYIEHEEVEEELDEDQPPQEMTGEMDVSMADDPTGEPTGSLLKEDASEQGSQAEPDAPGNEDVEMNGAAEDVEDAELAALVKKESLVTDEQPLNESTMTEEVKIASESSQEKHEHSTKIEKVKIASESSQERHERDDSQSTVKPSAVESVSLNRDTGRDTQRKPTPSYHNHERSRGDVPSQGSRRSSSADNRRPENHERGPPGGGRYDEARRPLERRWEPAGRRDERGGPRRDDRGPGPSGGRGPQRGRR
ncbi:hypothetical protein MPSEU_000826900 [Mayamaea pseudoterrestris]|nr:hypothetical protein MPSEU_000826900 [Mayamaea pseudoterrestris]